MATPIDGNGCTAFGDMFPVSITQDEVGASYFTSYTVVGRHSPGAASAPRARALEALALGVDERLAWRRGLQCSARIKSSPHEVDQVVIGGWSSSSADSLEI